MWGTRPLVAGWRRALTLRQSRQRERYVDSLCRSGIEPYCASRNDDILLSVAHISCRGRPPRVRQLRFPQQFSGPAVKGVEFVVVECGSNEKEPTRRQD